MPNWTEKLRIVFATAKPRFFFWICVTPPLCMWNLFSVEYFKHCQGRPGLRLTMQCTTPQGVMKTSFRFLRNGVLCKSMLSSVSLFLSLTHTPSLTLSCILTETSNPASTSLLRNLRYTRVIVVLRSRCNEERSLLVSRSRDHRNTTYGKEKHNKQKKRELEETVLYCTVARTICNAFLLNNTLCVQVSNQSVRWRPS